MGRAPCCDKTKVKRGPWSPDEDATLINYLEKHGTAENWISLPQRAGLTRCGKSCRLRWLNYLRPDIKHGAFTEEEDRIIFALYNKMGSRWSVIASQLSGRTDNDVKNHWNTKLKKKLLAAKASATSYSLLHGSIPSPALAYKPEEAQNPSFLAMLTDTSSTMPVPLQNDANFALNSNGQNTVQDFSYYSAQGLDEASELVSFAKSMHSFSPSGEGSSISGSSSLAMDSSYVSWTGGADEGFSINCGSGFSYDVSSGIWSQEMVSEAVPKFCGNMFSSFYVDTNAQEMCQNVTDQYSN